MKRIQHSCITAPCVAHILSFVTKNALGMEVRVTFMSHCARCAAHILSFVSKNASMRIIGPTLFRGVECAAFKFLATCICNPTDLKIGVCAVVYNVCKWGINKTHESHCHGWILDFLGCLSSACAVSMWSHGDKNHWPQYMDSWLARFCILVNACHRKPLGSHFTPVKTLDRHTDLCTCQCMKCNRWQVFSFKFHENSGKKMEKFPRSSRLWDIYWKLLKKVADIN